MISEKDIAQLIKICKQSKKYSKETQIQHLQEEMGELIVAINRQWRNRSTDDDIQEEIIDVLICCFQLGYFYFDETKTDKILQNKIKKFEKRVKEGFVKQ